MGDAGGGSFLGIPKRKVDKPSWESFRTGISNAFGWANQPRSAWDGLLPGVVPTPTPSRGTVRDMTGGALSPDPKDVERRQREADAKAEAARVAAGGAPRNTVPRSSHTPTTTPEAKRGTGPALTGEPLPSHTPRASATDPGSYDAQSIVRMPDGRIVVTEDPAGVTASEGGSVDPAGARSDVVSGPAGTAYTPSENLLVEGPEADFSQVNLPTDEDRSPGWATRKAYNDLYAAGNLSMNARDVMDRRAFEVAEEARESGIELARAERDQAILQASVDPYQMAQLEAEGKYGAQAIEEKGTRERIQAALHFYSQISAQIKEIEEQLAGLDPKSAQAIALTQTKDRLEQERREVGNLALGRGVRNPNENEFASMMAAIAGGGAAAPPRQ